MVPVNGLGISCAVKVPGVCSGGFVTGLNNTKQGTCTHCSIAGISLVIQ